MSFAVRKFSALLVTGVLSMALWFVAETTTTGLVGHVFGETALAGLSLLAPIFTALWFVAELIAFGTTISFSQAMGRGEVRRAREFFSLGLITSAVVGVLLSLALLFGADLYLAFYGASPEVTAASREFVSGYWPVPFLTMLLVIGMEFLAVEGDVLRCSLASIVFVVLNALFVWFGVRQTNSLATAALALALAEVFSIGLIATHLLSKSNALKFVRWFDWRDLRAILSRSFGDSAQQLGVAIIIVAVTKVVIARLGSAYLPVLQVALTLWGCADFLGGIGGAIPPLVTVYHGEENPAGVRRVMRFATALAAGGGFLFALFLCVSPESLCNLVGLSDPALLAEATTVIHLLAPVLIALSVANLYSAYFACIDQSRWSLMISLTVYGLGPILCVLLGSAIAPRGIWVGLAMGPYLALGAVAAALFFAVSRDRFPLLLNRRVEEKTTSRSLRLTDAAVVEVSELIGEKLKRNPGVALKTSLLVEEVLLAVRDRNAGKKVLAEVTLIDGDEARLILRDDGEIFDITDADAKISSLRGFVVANLMEKQLNRQNLIITGFNRNVFSFKV